MTSDEIWWVELSSLVSSKSIIYSLIKALDSGLTIFGKLYSVFDELPSSWKVKEPIAFILT